MNSAKCEAAQKVAEDFQLEPTPPESSAAELLESSESTVQVPPNRQYCVFRAGRERFCLPVLEVEEVVDWPLVTRVPLGPPFLMGVFNLRGSIIPVVDIAVTDGRRPGLSPRSVVVAVLSGNEPSEDLRVGIAADEVVGTYPALPESLIDQIPHDMPHCRGMLKHDDRLALVMDLSRMVQAFPVPAI
jgi:chemotaxis signal transduction protein